MENHRSDFEAILKFFQNQFAYPAKNYADKQRRLKLPIVPPNLVQELLNNLYLIFFHEPPLLKLSGDFIVVGSLYGSILDLLQILQKFGLPPKKKYLFLGNIIGYGEFSTATLIMVYILKILFPQDVYIIRGLQEFSKHCMSNGFKDELDIFYKGCDFYNPFLRSFSVLPVVAIVNNDAFCVSGGIGREMSSIEVLEQIKRPLEALNTKLHIELFNSDPTNVLPMYLPSGRGEGNLFGERACMLFLREFKLNVIIRGKQYVEKGYQEMFNGQLISVCSSTNIANDNVSGVVVFTENARSCVNFDHLKIIKRNDATYIASISNTNWRVQKETESLYLQHLNSTDHIQQNVGLRLSTLAIGRPNLKPENRIPKTLSRTIPSKKIKISTRNISLSAQAATRQVLRY